MNNKLNNVKTIDSGALSKVKKQNYYNRNGVEVITIIRKIYDFFGSDLNSFEAACIYNILKYLMRYKYKDNPKQDLKKINVIVNWLKDEIKEDE